MPDYAWTSIALGYTGAVLLLLGEIAALLRWRDLRQVLIYSTAAELGFVLMAFQFGEIGQLGGGMHVVYQAVMRILVVMAAAKLAGAAGGWRVERLIGVGRTSVFYAVLFAFGMFSLLGLSPFKGALSRFLVLHELVAHGQWPLAVATTLASIMAAIYVIKLIQAICFAAPAQAPVSPPQKPRLSLFNVGIAVAAFLTAGMNFYPEPVAATAALIFGLSVHMPHHEGPWPVLSILPYAGGFALLALGHLSARVRDVAAILIAGATLWFAATDSGLDPVSYLFALLFAAVVLAVVVYSVAYMKHEGGERYFHFFLFLMAGSLIGLATAGDLGSFYLFWELMTWSSYLLIVHTRSDEALKAGRQYFIMCVGGAYVMLLGIVGVGVASGGFEFSVIQQGIAGMDATTRLALAAALFVGFAVKAGIVPLHGWLPVAHPAAPSPVSAPLSSILTKTGLLGMFKVVIVGFGLAYPTDLGLVICALGVVSLIYGEVMAWRQTDLKRMLAYSTIAQVGEIVALVGLASSLALAAASAHVLTHGAMKTLLFLGAGALILRAGSRRLGDVSGLGRTMPVTAVCLTIGLLAIMGVPPFAGFYSKFAMVYASIDAGALPVAMALLLGGVIGVLYYGRLIRIVMFDPATGGTGEIREAPVAMLLPLGVLAAGVVVAGLFPNALLNLASTAGAWLDQARGMPTVPLPSFDVDWPLAAIVCGVGATITYFAGRTGRLTAGSCATATMALALAAVVAQRDSFDALSFGFAIVIAGLGLLNLFYTVGYFAHHGHRSHRFLASFMLMIGGLIGMTYADDLFSFFFFWEIMSSWTLYFAIVHEETEESLGEGFKYFAFNMIGASFLFLGVAMLAVGAGSFAFDDLPAAAASMPRWQLALGVGAAALGFAMKAAMFTVRVDYQMHPATAPTPVSGYISAVLLKSGPIGAFKLIVALGGGAALARLGTVFGLDPISYGLALLGAVTALYAGLMAVIQTGIKRLLIYSTVAQLGYVMCALALGDALSTAGGLAHALNHALLKNTLFLAAGAILAQAHVTSLDDLGGVGRRMPLTFAMFLIAGLSLAGLPPLNGLGSKWLIYQGALVSGHPFLALMLMGASLTTLAAVLKFAHAGFLGTPSGVSETLHEAPLSMLIPMLLLTVLSIAVGVFPGLLLVPVAQIQAALGLPAVDVTWLGPLPGPYGWHPLSVWLPMAVLVAVGWAMLRVPRHATRRTHAHSCGVGLAASQMRISASNLYPTPSRLIRKVLFVQEKNA